VSKATLVLIGAVLGYTTASLFEHYGLAKFLLGIILLVLVVLLAAFVSALYVGVSKTVRESRVAKEPKT
jgi:hypothetical protein